MDQQELAQQLLAQAREQGIDLVGPDGLLNRLTKNVLETALDAEMDEHLGYEKHDVSGRGSGNSRNGTRTKTVLTEIGPVEIDVARDTGSTFDPQIVRKRQRRLSGVDEIVLSLSAKGAHDRGNRGALRRGVWRKRLQGHHLAGHGEGHRRDDRMAESAPGPGLPGDVSSTRSTSRSVTGRSRTGRSMSRSASASMVNGTSSGCGPETAAKGLSSGSRC
jgi:Transposase, Mutator family